MSAKVPLGVPRRACDTLNYPPRLPSILPAFHNSVIGMLAALGTITQDDIDPWMRR